MITRKGIVWILCLLAASSLFGQAQPVAEVSVEKNQVLLGEPFRFRIQLQLPEGSTGQVFLPDSIPHFEFTQPPLIDSSNEKGARNIKAVYYLSSFDSGHWVIPSWQLMPGVQTDTIGVDVVFSSFDPTQPYHDIKDIIEVKEKKKQPWWWLAAGGALLLALLAFYFFRKKRPVPEAARPGAVADPYAEAMRQLKALQQQKPAAKIFHTQLTSIFRLYVYRQTGILSLQQTTDDLVLQLKDAGWPADLFSRLGQSLRLSDFVKFAKFSPAATDDENCWQQIKEAIDWMEQSRKAGGTTQQP